MGYAPGVGPCAVTGSQPGTPLVGNGGGFTLPPCPAPGGASPSAPGVPVAQVPGISPSVLAIEFWQRIPLPVPRPSIPPGWALTGKPAYLVTDGTTDPPAFKESTPLGELTVVARGTYWVDWGDGTPPGFAGPYASEGLPWPSGRIRHTYDVAGSYDVVVREDWTASWSLGAASGTLGVLHTQASIRGLQARQLQSLIIY